MKKILGMLLIGILLVAITGCDTKKEGNNMNKEDLNNTDTKSAVIYFSATNNTEKVARTISEVISSDLIEIIPKEEYTTEDLNYNNDNCRANQEQNDETARPEISNQLKLDDYDTIYLGYPIWWGKEPKIILTLLDNYNLEGKDIILFCTSGGSGIETSVDNIKNYNSKLNIITGKKFSSSVSKEEIQDWINNM